MIGFTPGYTSILFWIPLYLLAATIACCKNDMISHFSMTRSYLCVILYCSFIAYLLLNNVDEKASAYTLYRLTSPILIWNIIDLSKSVRNKRILAAYPVVYENNILWIAYTLAGIIAPLLVGYIWHKLFSFLKSMEIYRNNA